MAGKIKVSKLKSEMDKFLEIFLVAGVGLIGFFLVRFYYLVDEIRKDVKEILIDRAASNQIILGHEKDITEIRAVTNTHESRINKLEINKQKRTT